MTLLYSHDVRMLEATASHRFTARRALRRIRAAFRAIHRAIAAAKIHRLRNELLLHRGHEDWARINLDVGTIGGDATRYPRTPVVLGEKWDY
ncbi:hypothetical protein IC762_27680 [Bradyrhizobium genosp. L]|uniref:hypothetical protein n=1 Tax=Bradyrhizobium genosp. L TaxID=83637 RepID=UPI0018A2E1BB|nr:hypothetical protein [Bradyrhizobium genosp. L]QPF83458.1 hypothetical protein IC762_27680 [Bradyrhizobium genosp. L]